MRAAVLINSGGRPNYCDRPPETNFDNVLDRLSHKKQEASIGLCLLIFIVRNEELLVPSELKCEA